MRFVRTADGFGGADVYDFTVTLTCGGGVAPQQAARLSCTHSTGTESCSMGRIEVYNPTASHGDHETTGAGTWGTVCGHYTWCVLIHHCSSGRVVARNAITNHLRRVVQEQ